MARHSPSTVSLVRLQRVKESVRLETVREVPPPPRGVVCKDRPTNTGQPPPKTKLSRAGPIPPRASHVASGLLGSAVPRARGLAHTCGRGAFEIVRGAVIVDRSSEAEPVSKLVYISPGEARLIPLFQGEGE